MVSAARSLVIGQSERQAEEPPSPPEQSGGEDNRSYKNIILILVSAPLLHSDGQTPVEALAIQTEIDAIYDALLDIPDLVEVEIIVEIATAKNLLKVFSRKQKPLVIHFIGHGIISNNQTSLMLEDKFGLARTLDRKELELLLESRDEPPCQVAVLNACHSEGMADIFVRSGVPHVIGIDVEDGILDIAARSFAEVFYYALFNGNSVLDAFLDGRRALLIHDELKSYFNAKTFKQDINLEEYCKFQLLPSNANHEAALAFASAVSGDVIYPEWEGTNLGQVDSTFVGRQRDLYEIVKRLDFSFDKKCIVLHGIGGIGKTSLAQAVGRWQHERQRWRDGVWFVGLRNVDSVAAMREKIVDVLGLGLVNADSNEQLARILTKGQRLLILDDLDELLNIPEQIPELVDLLGRLLDARRSKLLITTRKDLPSQIVHGRYDVVELSKVEAIQAFRKYAPPQSDWGQSRPEDFEDILRFLDGYPMALRLAASYLQSRRCGLSELKRELAEALDDLGLGAERNRETSLTVALDISYRVLPQGARDIFPLLALFPAGLSPVLMTVVIGEDAIKDVIALLKYSMAEGDLFTRITLPEPARAYAETKLIDGLWEKYYLRALEYFDGFAQEISQAFFEEIDIETTTQKLKQEQGNLKAVLNWGYDHEQRQDKSCFAARITGYLGQYWQWVEPGVEPLKSFRRAVEAAKRNGDLFAQADVLKAIGDRQCIRDGLEAAQSSYDEAVGLYQSIFVRIEQDTAGADIQTKLGDIFKVCQQFDLSLASYRKAFGIARLSDKQKAANIQIYLGRLFVEFRDQGEENLDIAIEHYEVAQELFREEGNQLWIDKTKRLIVQTRRLGAFSQVELKTLSFETVEFDHRGEIARREQKHAQYFFEELGDGIGLDMVLISEGYFVMGAPESDLDSFKNERPQHLVRVPEFCFGRYLVTQEQWRVVASWEQIERELQPEPSYFKGDRYPVEQVSWDDAKEFCARLSQKTGRNYRLPSEAEWEYACRAVDNFQSPVISKQLSKEKEKILIQEWNKKHYRPYSYGDRLSPEVARFWSDSPVAVGSFPANSFGLHDMHGNLWERCEDEWRGDYENAPNDGGVWESNNHVSKVLRGGAWSSLPRLCRSASRNYSSRGYRFSNIGFRVACSLPRIP